MSLSVRNLGAIIVDELRLQFLRCALEQIGKRGSLLDLGCGQKPFGELYAHHCDFAVGADVPASLHGLSHIDVQADGVSLPFQNFTFDVVLCTEVMEHVAEPQRMLCEIYRILKPGGFLILTTPFLVAVHEAPFDFYRYTPHGLRHLLERASFCLLVEETFAEAFGVLISFSVQVQLKAWNALASKLHLPSICSLLNPFVFLMVYLPQRLYLIIIKMGRRLKVIQRIIGRLNYTAKGYGVLAVKV